MSSAEGWSVVPTRGKGTNGKTKASSKKLSKQQEVANAVRDAAEEDMTELQQEKIFHRIKDVLAPALKASAFSQLLTSLLGGRVFDTISILGVGRLTSDASVFQTALGVILAEYALELNPSAECIICDPILRNSDAQVFQRLGFRVDTSNARGKICVDKVTLFFMPHCPYRLYSNILWANWGHNLGKITILGNSFESYRVRRVDTSADPADCIKLLHPFTREQSVWTRSIETGERARVLQNMTAAFADLSVIDFPEDILNNGLGVTFFEDSRGDSSIAAASLRPTEELIDEATRMDEELF